MRCTLPCCTALRKTGERALCANDTVTMSGAQYIGVSCGASGGRLCVPYGCA
jgi:hypothetical protein